MRVCENHGNLPARKRNNRFCCVASQHGHSQTTETARKIVGVLYILSGYLCCSATIFGQVKDNLSPPSHALSSRTCRLAQENKAISANFWGSPRQPAPLVRRRLVRFLGRRRSSSTSALRKSKGGVGGWGGRSFGSSPSSVVIVNASRCPPRPSLV